VRVLQSSHLLPVKIVYFQSQPLPSLHFAMHVVRALSFIVAKEINVFV
jgi:hypothetical protein